MDPPPSPLPVASPLGPSNRWQRLSRVDSVLCHGVSLPSKEGEGKVDLQGPPAVSAWIPPAADLWIPRDSRAPLPRPRRPPYTASQISHGAETCVLTNYLGI